MKITKKQRKLLRRIYNSGTIGKHYQMARKLVAKGLATFLFHERYSLTARGRMMIY